MNFFFSIENPQFEPKLTIPKFQNRNQEDFIDRSLYSAEIIDDEWSIDTVNCSQDKNFFYLDKINLSNKKIFFISTKNTVKNLPELKRSLIDLDNFTDTDPAYRSNMEIKLTNGGFSSYQAEYPYSLANKKSDILSNTYLLTNKFAEKNYLFFKNIYVEPITYESSGFIIDLKQEKILRKINLLSNTTNIIPLLDDDLGKDIYFFSKGMSGIPIFVSEKDGHLSMEHTHPPHLYLLGNEKFKIVNQLKKKIHDKFF